ncbi:4-fold beta flower protein [Methylobacterium marchantiae]|uniref:4-fold beta flower protein n=1 Tax=Methylobacterium marchantiae TaxID=600331 RepID=A0ABW3X593_9HYPH|nr:hypothetical protein AIGOOFII_2793 [Methylobacterium marchantiae]
MIEFFDHDGQATAVSPDERTVYLWNGNAAAFIQDGRIYAYSGRFIGWVENGWIFADDGRRLLFEFDAVGGPEKPQRQSRQAPSPAKRRPEQGAPQAHLPKPAFSREWSSREFKDLI